MRISVGQKIFVIVVKIMNKGGQKKPTNVCYTTNATKRAGDCLKAYINPKGNDREHQKLRLPFFVKYLNAFALFARG